MAGFANNATAQTLVSAIFMCGEQDLTRKK
jgi:hypothetical protein